MNDYRKPYMGDVPTGNWLLTILLSLVPGLNLLVWLLALGSKYDAKRNFAKAAWLLFFMLIILAAVAYIVLCLTNKVAPLNDWLKSISPKIPEIPKAF